MSQEEKCKHRVGMRVQYVMDSDHVSPPLVADIVRVNDDGTANLVYFDTDFVAWRRAFKVPHLTVSPTYSPVGWFVCLDEEGSV